MTVHKKTYRPFLGDRVGAGSRYQVVGRHELRLLWRKKWVRRLLVISAIPLVASVVTLYVQIVIEQVMQRELLGGQIFENLYRAQVFFVVLMMAAAGSDLVAKDVASHAHQLYFARPLSCAQYVLGKVLAVFAVLALLVLAPGLILAFAQLLLAPETDYAGFGQKVLAVAVYGTVFPAVAAIVIALLSSWGRRARYVGLVWVGLYFFSDIVGQALVNGPGWDWARLISLRVLFVDSGRFFYADQPPDAWALVVLVTIGLAALAALYRRVVALERRES